MVARIEVLYTVEEVAQILKVDIRTVYDHRKRLGGFYPAGIRVLRFRKEEIDGIVARPDTQGLEVRGPSQRQEADRRGIQDQGGGADSTGGRSKGRKAETQDRGAEKRCDPYGLLGGGNVVS